jgi:hypothetical protein
VIVIAGWLFLIAVVINGLTDLLVPVAAAIPTSVRRINLVLVLALAAVAVLRFPLSPAYRAFGAVLFCLSAIMLAISASQDALWVLAVGVLLYVEIFWLLPRINRRLPP